MESIEPSPGDSIISKLSFGQFLAEWMRRAWTGRFRRAKELQGIAALICGVAALVVREQWPDMSPLLRGLTWAPFIIFGATFVVAVICGLITAPYGIYIEQTTKAKGLEGAVADLRHATKPILEFVDAGEMASAKIRGMPDKAIVHRICVRNTSSTAKVESVELTLVAVVECETGRRRPIGKRLREMETGATQVTITPGAKRYFEPLFVRPDKNPPRMYLAPEGNNTSQYTWGPGRYQAEIEATSNATQPQLSAYDIQLENGGKVRISRTP